MWLGSLREANCACRSAARRVAPPNRECPAGPSPNTLVSKAMMAKVGAAASDSQWASPRAPGGAKLSPRGVTSRLEPDAFTLMSVPGAAAAVCCEIALAAGDRAVLVAAARLPELAKGARRRQSHGKSGRRTALFLSGARLLTSAGLPSVNPATHHLGLGNSPRFTRFSRASFPPIRAVSAARIVRPCRAASNMLRPRASKARPIAGRENPRQRRQSPKPWTNAQMRQFEAHSDARTPLAEVAKALKRTEAASAKPHAAFAGRLSRAPAETAVRHGRGSAAHRRVGFRRSDRRQGVRQQPPSSPNSTCGSQGRHLSASTPCKASQHRRRDVQMASSDRALLRQAQGVQAHRHAPTKQTPASMPSSISPQPSPIHDESQQALARDQHPDGRGPHHRRRHPAQDPDRPAGGEGAHHGLSRSQHDDDHH